MVNVNGVRGNAVYQFLGNKFAGIGGAVATAGTLAQQELLAFNTTTSLGTVINYISDAGLYLGAGTVVSCLLINFVFGKESASLDSVEIEDADSPTGYVSVGDRLSPEQVAVIKLIKGLDSAGLIALIDAKIAAKDLSALKYIEDKYGEIELTAQNQAFTDAMKDKIEELGKWRLQLITDYKKAAFNLKMAIANGEEAKAALLAVEIQNLTPLDFDGGEIAGLAVEAAKTQVVFDLDTLSSSLLNTLTVGLSNIEVDRAMFVAMQDLGDIDGARQLMNDLSSSLDAEEQELAQKISEWILAQQPQQSVDDEAPTVIVADQGMPDLPDDAFDADADDGLGFLDLDPDQDQGEPDQGPLPDLAPIDGPRAPLAGDRDPATILGVLPPDRQQEPVTRHDAGPEAAPLHLRAEDFPAETGGGREGEPTVVLQAAALQGELADHGAQPQVQDMGTMSIGDILAEIASREPARWEAQGLYQDIVFIETVFDLLISPEAYGVALIPSQRNDVINFLRTVVSHYEKNPTVNDDINRLLVQIKSTSM